MTSSLSPLLAPMLSSAAMRAVCDDLAYLQHMLDFEAALARAEARVGILPSTAAEAIAAAAKSESFDATQLANDALLAGALPIPVVKALTEKVRLRGPAAAGFVHWGATSQDVADTALVLLLKRAQPVLESEPHLPRRVLLRCGISRADGYLLGRRHGHAG